jgi:dipeptidyl aminopeptidase/acylaminoacyl peptidase
MTKKISNYGSWPSAISSQYLTRGQCRLSEPQLHDKNCFWLESRPEEKGRGVVVFRKQNGHIFEVTPTDISVRTRIHEYGGGCYCIHGDTIYFVNNSDQRIYRQEIGADLPPAAISPEGNYRYGDLCICEKQQQLICVCEIHDSQRKQPENCIVAIDLNGSDATEFHVLVSGNDFYSNPRVSPDGRWLSWLTWNHPNMPWDNNACWLAKFETPNSLKEHRKVAGGDHQESIFQPQWSPGGDLYFVSDRTSWWNLYRYQLHSQRLDSVTQKDAEFATASWVFGMSTYGFLNDSQLFCCYTRDGQWQAAIIDTQTHHFQSLNLPYNSLEAVYCDPENHCAVMIGASKNSADAIIYWQDGLTTVFKNSQSKNLQEEDIAHAQTINFQNPRRQIVQGFFYQPQNAEHQGPKNDLPPLIAICHGGPTGSTRLSFDLKIQYWTNRGFAVFDINYSGSTGYGRPYRDRLKGQWGVLDVEDICAGVQHLIEQQYVDPEKILIRGSSAGGFTTLAALTFHDIFKAGTSLYGIGDLSILAKDTHKFESHYLDSLIGQYPEERATYLQRSPLYHVDQLNCPVLFLQGQKDRVVPPNQAEAMVRALEKKGVAVAYQCYAEEGHGFRQAKNIRHSRDVEYAFYAQILGLTPAEPLPEVPFVSQKP